jgi:hypothetical protein
LSKLKVSYEDSIVAEMVEGVLIRLLTCECGNLLRIPFNVGTGAVVPGTAASFYRRWPAGLGLVWGILGSHS